MMLPRKALTVLTALLGASVLVLGTMGQASITRASGGSGGGVTTITGTANQVVASASTGAVTLSLPQSIATSSTPQFAALKLGTSLVFSSTAPTIASGFGSSVAVVGSSAAYRLTITAGNSSSVGVLTLPTATTGWACHLENMTENLGAQNSAEQSGTTTTTASFIQYDFTGTPTPFQTSDVIIGTCAAF